MTEADENNFYRLIAFLVDVSPKVVRKYFDRNVLKGSSFESYLNGKKHILYHLYSKLQCCCCNTGNPYKGKFLSQTQFQLLFTDKGKHVKRYHTRTSVCICKYEAKSNISLTVLDVTLAHCILRNCETLGPADEHWFHNLREIRNAIVHKAEVKSITDNHFSKYWQKLEGVVVGLALKVDNDYKLTITSQIEYLKSRQILSDDKLKVCTVLHEWWRKMCCEMEKSQQEYHEQFEKRFRSIEGSIETSDGNLQEMRGDFMKKLDILENKIDAISVHYHGNKSTANILSMSETVLSTNDGRKIFPVLMFMETPNDWDTMKLINAIEKIRNTWDAIEGKLRIRSYSTEELKINLDIANNLIQQPQTLNTEIKTFVKDVLRTANVDTNIASDIKITLDIREKKVADTDENINVNQENLILSEEHREPSHDLRNTKLGMELEESTLPFGRTRNEDEPKKENLGNLGNSQREDGFDPSNPSKKNVIGSPLNGNSIAFSQPVENTEDIPNTLQDKRANGKKDYEEAEMSFERSLDEDESKIENPSQMSNPTKENLLDIRYLAEKKEDIAMVLDDESANRKEENKEGERSFEGTLNKDESKNENTSELSNHLMENLIYIKYPAKKKEPTAFFIEDTDEKEVNKEGEMSFERTIKEDELEKENPSDLSNPPIENSINLSNSTNENLIDINYLAEKKEDIAIVLDDKSASKKAECKGIGTNDEIVLTLFNHKRELDFDIEKIPFHGEKDFPTPEPYQMCVKTYPSHFRFKMKNVHRY